VESERRTAGTFLGLVALSVPIAAGLLYFTTLGRRIVPAPVRPAVAESRAPAAAQTAEPPRPSASEPPAATPAATSGDIPPPVAAPAGDQLTIALTAKRPCWVSATVDGQKSIERLLQAGEQQIVTVRREMVLTAGDASAITVRFNGADGRPLGNTGDVVTARFTLTNYKDYLQVR